MAVTPVLIYPDPRLKTTSEPCRVVTEEFTSIARDLLDTMRAHERCVGLSAPQIGHLRRIVVVDVTGHPRAEESHGTLLFVDPVIVSAEGSEIGREGCLSLPDITADVPRAISVVVRGLDLQGQTTTVATRGFEARALQHEIDHLDGILILDRVASPSEIFPRRSGF